MPRGRLQREEVVDAVGALPEQGLPGAVDGRHAVLVDQAVGGLPAVAVPLGGAVVGVVGGRDEVRGVGEAGHPLAARVDRVPAHVIHVQMRVDHEIDALRGHPRLAEQGEQPAAPPVERPHAGPVTIVAHPRVDHDGLPAAPQHPGLQRHHGPVLGPPPVVGHQPLGVLLPQPGGSRGEHLGGRQVRALPLHHPDDLDLTEPDVLDPRVAHAADPTDGTGAHRGRHVRSPAVRRPGRPPPAASWGPAPPPSTLGRTDAPKETSPRTGPHPAGAQPPDSPQPLPDPQPRKRADRVPANIPTAPAPAISANPVWAVPQSS